MRTIHVITKYFYPVSGGIELNILEIDKNIAKMGFNVIIHTCNNTYNSKKSLISEEVIQGLKVKRYNWHFFGFFPKINYENGSILNLHNFNIFPFLHILINVWIQKKIFNKKITVILTPHGGFNPKWEMFGNLSRLIKQNYNKYIGRNLINSTVDVIRAISLWEKNEMIKEGLNEKLITIIPNGLESEAYLDVEKLASPKIKEFVKKSGDYIIQIGRIYKIKNYETAIKALANIQGNLKYLIVGETEGDGYLPELKSLIKKLNLEMRVFFVGIVRGIDKYYLIKHAKLMVHMALYESFCNVVHEAMSQNVVCLVADNTALPLLIKNGENGYCLPTFDDKKLSEKINFVVSNYNSKIIKNMRFSKYNTDSLLSWSQIADKLVEIIKKES